MATVVTYNGITLYNVTTTLFRQTMEYDPSRTDVQFCRYSMAFEGLVHAQGTTQGAPLWAGAASGQLPPVQQAYNAISLALWTPRRRLAVVMGGVGIIAADPPGTIPDLGANDVDNGPKPKSVTITHVTSNATIGPTFHVSFEIEFAQTSCPNESSGGPNPILENRWSIGESMDDEYFTTRTINGQMRASGNDFDVDAYRLQVVPTLENGFKRERFDWKIEADGLTITYAVQDKQVHTSAPWPAAKCQVRHSEGTANGAAFETELHIALQGHPGADKRDLFALAARIVEDRVGKLREIQTQGNKVVGAFTMVDIVGERNGIELYLKLTHTLKSFGTDVDLKNPAAYLGTPLGSQGRPLGSFANLGLGTQGNNRVYPKSYDPTVTAAYGGSPPLPWGYLAQGGEQNRGTANDTPLLRLALYCYLQTPCQTHHEIGYVPQATSTPSTGQPTIPQPRDTTQIRYNPTITPPPLTAPTLSSTANEQGLYTVCAAETILAIDPQRVQLPIAQSADDYKSGNDTSVIVTLALSQARLTFHIECERGGSWPSVPEPIADWTYKSGGAKPIRGYLAKAVLTPMPPTVDATVSRAIYHVSARYTYLLSRPPQRGETIPIGVLPFTNFVPDNTALQLSSLYSDPNQQALFGPASPGGSKPGNAGY